MTRHAAALAAFFMPLALAPWLNPVSGGAMTAGIPLLVGWVCAAWLFSGLPARRWSVQGAAVVGSLALAVLWSLVFDSRWQLLVVGLLIVAVSAVVGARLVQEFELNGSKSRNSRAWQHGINLIAWSWLLAALLNAGIGLLQYFQRTAWLGELVNHASKGQVYGNLRQRNQFASLMVMGLWSLWYVWQGASLQRLVQCVHRATSTAMSAAIASVVAWLVMLPLVAGLALTLSRTGSIQFAALLVLVPFFMWRSQRTGGAGASTLPLRQVLVWLAGMVAVYIATAYVLPHLHGGIDIWARMEGKGDRACISRKVLWSNVLQLIAQKPWLGWGWGELDYAHYQAQYPGMRFCDLLDNAHNLPLHLAVELGVPVAVLACAAIVWWILRNRPWSEAAPQRQLMWGVLLTIGVHSLFEYPLWYSHFQLATGLAVGVLLATHTTPHTNPTPVLAGYALWAQRLLAGCLLLGLAYASFDFVRVTQLYTLPEDRVWPFHENTQQQAERSFLYRNAVRFADLSTTTTTAEQAHQQLAEAQALMHYSPESRVIIRMIEALRLLGRQDEADAAEAQFRSVYPQAHAQWLKGDASGEETP